MELAFALSKVRGLNVAVCLHTAEPVPQDEWNAALAHYARLSERDADRARMLVITDGGGPDAKQRSQLKAIWDGRAVTTSVIVPGMNNLVKRGLMTALTWVNPRMAFFVPSQLRPALRHLGLESEQPALWLLLRALQQQLTPVRTLQLIEAAAQRASLPDELPPQRRP